GPPMEPRGNVRPKLFECVRRDPGGKAQHGTCEGVLRIGLAGLAPCVRQEIVARRRDVPCIGRDDVAITVPCYESPLHAMQNALLERLPGHALISRILAPERAQARLHRIAGQHTGYPYSVAVAEA